MYQHLCIAEHCGIPTQHTDTCPGEGCRGCLPRLAADGLRLCDVDTRRIAEDACTAAVLYEDLALTLIRKGRGGERVASSGSGAPVPDDAVMEAREAIRATLVSLCRLIAEERGSHLPADAITALGAYIAHHAVWLAAHRAADEHARDLRDIASDPRTRRLAYPAGTDRLYIGDCPLLVRDLDGVESICGTRLYQYAGQLFIGCDGCGTDETVEWWQRELVGDAGTVVDAYAGAADLAMRHARPVDPALIRKWASLGKPRIERLPRGFIGPPRGVVVVGKGKDERGRTLYDLGDLRLYAHLLWGEKTAVVASVAA
ncbi:hypothetical protein [Micromonospora tarensis]|uniref:Uncharacterized protein n=1 Tax=Micromonospora tarensis TaxID=2806100 RepID=A0ABS1YRG3_9ACTN|nr:hypothetical protein [Micromonospora tarensis]MBM0279676.1 hypothetical protein [Micromonospora tarensis]